MRKKQDNNEIGIFDFRICKIRFIYSAGLGGCFWMKGDEAGRDLPTIEVDFGYTPNNFEDLYSVVFHEIMEFLMTIRRFRYSSHPPLDFSHERYTFTFDHREFNELIQCLSYGFVDLQPVLLKKFKEYHRKKRDAKKTK